MIGAYYPNFLQDYRNFGVHHGYSDPLIRFNMPGKIGSRVGMISMWKRDNAVTGSPLFIL